jgi:RNA polymerase sigma-70 factor (sigma-E family)
MRQQTRDREFGEYFAARGPALRRTAWLIVRDWHTAEDVLQGAFAKLYVAWGRIRADTREAYARRVVVNEALSTLRRVRPEDPTDQVPDRPARGLDVPVLDLDRALDLLPARQRAVVALRFVDDLSVAEVARVLDVAEGTVKSQTARALDTLRQHLPELAPELVPALDTSPDHDTRSHHE